MIRGLLIWTVFCCAAVGGVTLCRMLRERARILDAIATTVASLAEAMERDGLTLREAMQWIEDTGGRPEGRTLAHALLTAWDGSEDLPRRWREAVESLCQNQRLFRLLLEEERAWLAAMLTDQAAAQLDPSHVRQGWVRKWRERAERAGAEYEKKGMLYGKLGILVGIALAILML